MSNKTKLEAGVAIASKSEAPGIAPALPIPAGISPVCFVIDDEPGIQNIVASAATNLGFQVERFSSAGLLENSLDERTGNSIEENREDKSRNREFSFRLPNALTPNEVRPGSFLPGRAWRSDLPQLENRGAWVVEMRAGGDYLDQRRLE